MEFVRNFTDLNKGDVLLAGGKGASLGEMTQAGIPVPPGFVVLSDSFEHFITETQLKSLIDAVLHKVNHLDIHSVEQASQEIQAMILNAEMPQDIANGILQHFGNLGAEYVAVRSSATSEDSADAAWAGQLDSFLNIREDKVLEKVKRCWASLFTPRAIFYRFEKGLHGHHISVAVVVQKMVKSEVSGIAFSVHPVTEDPNQLIIEAGYGLGEAIVSGQITPDSYVVEKKSREIVDTYISEQERGLFRVDAGGNEWQEIAKEEGEKQKLTNEEVLELAKLIIHIEQHYGFPCDVEWAQENKIFYIVQSRPITTLNNSNLTSGPSVASSDLGDGPSDQSVSKDVAWHSEALEGFDPSAYEFHGLWKCPILVDYFWSIFHKELAKELDLPVEEIGTLTLNYGNYLAKTSIQDQLRNRILQSVQDDDKDFFTKLKQVIDREFEAARLNLLEVGELPPTGTNFQRSMESFRRLGALECMAYLLAYSFEPELEKWATKQSIHASELHDYIPQIKTPLIERQDELAELKKLFEQKNLFALDDEDILHALEKDPNLSEKFYSHLEKYGWVEIFWFIGDKLTPKRLLLILREFDASEKSRVTLKELDTDAQKLLFAASYVGYMKQVSAEYASICSMIIQPYFEACAEKLSITYSDLMNLLPSEIVELLDSNDQPKLKSLLVQRATDKWALIEKHGQLYVIDDSEDIKRLESTLLPQATESNELRGQTGFAGKVTGRVKIILNSAEFSKMEKGDVLVTTMTTPDFVTLMQLASAIVTDIGGLLSHAAIVSRELKTPCVIGTKFATQLLKDGDLVEVDATHGIVRILESKDGHNSALDNKNNADPVNSDVSPTPLEFEASAFRNWTVAYCQLAYQMWVTEFRRQFGWSISDICYSWNGDYTTAYRAPSEHLEKFFNYVVQQADSNPNYLEQIAIQAEQESAAEREYFDTLLEKDFSALTLAELKHLFKEFCQVILPPMPKFFMVMYFPQALELHPEYQERFAAANAWLLETRGKIDKVAAPLGNQLTEKFAAAVLTRHNVDPAFARFITLKEIESLCDDVAADSVDIPAIEKRTKQFLVAGGEVVGMDITAYLASKGWRLKEVSEQSLSGAVIYKGETTTLQGTARVVLNASQLTKVQSGEIVVSPMTTPEFAPLFHKVVALVTDEGGVTCHAAVVARELHIPTIVGTKNASQLINDGDKIELDFTTGEIRVIDDATDPLKQEGVFDAALWAEQGRWLQSPLVYTFFSYWHTADVVKIIVPELVFHTILSVDGYAFQYKKDRENILDYLKKRHEAKTLGELANTIDAHGKAVFATLQQELAKDNAYIYENITDFINHYKEFTGFWSIEAYMGDVITKLATETGYVASEADLFAKVHPHLRDTWIEKESHAVVAMAQKFIDRYGDMPFNPKLVENDPVLSSLVEKYQQDFGWSKISKWVGEPVTTEQVYARLAEEITNCRQGNHIESACVKGDESALDDIVKLSVVTAYWRAESGKMEMMMATRMREILEEIGAKNGLTYEQVLLLSPQELVAVIASGDLLIPHKDAILARHDEFFSYVTRDNQAIILTPQDATYAKIKDTLISKVDTTTPTNVLHGIGASPGTVKGKVRVIQSAKQFGEFEQDEILVAPETTPSFVPLMRMASAILTGKGGITSHAAIVSRELGKPCVIAIKDVIKILKTGDVVEVDAAKGEVRIVGQNSDMAHTILDTKWSHLGKWIEPALAAQSWLRYGEVAQQFFTATLDKKILYLNGDFFLSQHDSQLFKQEGYAAAKSQTKEFFTKILATVTEVADNTVAGAKQASISEFWAQYTQLTGVWMPLNNVAAGVEQYVQETNPEAFKLAKGYLDEKTSTLQQVGEMAALKEKIEAAIGKSLERTDEIPQQFDEAITDHIEKYAWLGSHHFSIARLTRENLIERMVLNTETASDNSSANADESLPYLIWLLDLMGFVRFKAAEASGYATYLFSGRLESLGRAHNLTYEQVMEHTIEEILAEKLSSKTASDRIKNTGFYYDGGEEHLLSSEVIDECTGRLLKVEATGDMLKGISVCPGQVEGVVKLVLEKSDMEGFEPGMILVAHETTPDVIFAMQKAGAIVTDFGGLTSHAAIIARELNKPCVVGTKCATQMLKDGDTVAVDAINGTIRIIN